MKNEVGYTDIKYYNTQKKPRRQLFIFTFLMWLLSKISLIGVKYKIKKINMKGLKGPYLLLQNHMYFVDFNLNAIATFPRKVYNVATIDGYYRRPLIMEMLGCICKRKFTNDLSVIRSMQYVVNKYKGVVSMYPEARYTPIGTTAILPDSLGKLVKLLRVPVVVLLHHGNYLRTPFWDKERARKVPLLSTMKLCLTAEQVEKLSVTEINEIIRKELTYNEYKYQKDNNILITESFRAENLHKVLYQCPSCKSEKDMSSKNSEIFCKKCGKRWTLEENGELSANDGITEFTHIPDWFEWERANVRKEIENGNYYFEDDVDVFSLPHPKTFTHLGQAKLTHDINNGFILKGKYKGKPYEIKRDPLGMYGLHVEYNYVYERPDDCIDISTHNDSFYCYPFKQNVITKLSFATEEIYKYKKTKLIEEKQNQQ